MKTTLFSFFSILVFIICLSNCSSDDDTIIDQPGKLLLPPGTSAIESSPQRTGDPDAGRDYLLNGNYVDAGIPREVFTQFFGTGDNLLGRTGDNEAIPYSFTAVDASNGVRVVTANCLQCHAQTLNGELIVGLGNAVADFTVDQSANAGLIDFGMLTLFGQNSPEWEAYVPFRDAFVATGPELITDVRGVNPAGKLAVVLAAHRRPVDLTWSDNELFDVPSGVIPEDIPAWWLMKKKNALYYNAGGQGDFARLIMASSLLSLRDSTKAREVDEHFADVVAYLKTMEPPPYPQNIDDLKANRGAVLFSVHCSKCHGSYGVEETYPNLLVSIDEVKTDSLLAYDNFAYGEFKDWYNSSWFAQSPYPARFIPERGYIAPPLDGIWATAPYLHNGSVPTVEDLLNSEQRPTYWKRSFNTSDIDYKKMGWNYTVENGGGDKSIYDTTLRGYSNSGHPFGDFLTDEERSNLIEYLKTL